MKSLLLRIRYLYLGFKNISKLNIGDYVICANDLFILSSYKFTDTNWYDHWGMTNVKTNDYEVHSEKNFKKIKSFKNIKNSILGTYRFYMINWHSIAKNNIKLKEVFKVDYLKFLENNK